MPNTWEATSIEEWAYTIDWWAIIIIIILTASIIFIFRTQSLKVAGGITLISILALFISLANVYATPIDFLIFWNEEFPYGQRGRW